jgi:hypothetical protein
MRNEPKVGATAREVDVGQGDGVAGDRMEAPRRVGQLGQLAHERVHARRRLLERVRAQLVAARVPAAVRVPSDLAGLDLEHEEARSGWASTMTTSPSIRPRFALVRPSQATFEKRR